MTQSLNECRAYEFFHLMGISIIPTQSINVNIHRVIVNGWLFTMTLVKTTMSIRFRNNFVEPFLGR